MIIKIIADTNRLAYVFEYKSKPMKGSRLLLIFCNSFFWETPNLAMAYLKLNKGIEKFPLNDSLTFDTIINFNTRLTGNLKKYSFFYSLKVYKIILP